MTHIIRKISFLYKYYKEYGFRYSIILIFSSLFTYKPNGSFLSWWFLQKKHHIILNYFTKNYYIELERYDKEQKKDNQYKNCIWTAWLQGEENAPEVIKLTLASIRKNADGHQVVVLTDNNIDEYVRIPPEIVKKHKVGIMLDAHYSDVIRMMVLAKYGGLWLDATIYMYEAVDKAIFSKQFYSVGLNFHQSRYVSDNKWLVGVIGGCEDSYYLKQISKMLNAYWIDHELGIDYFVFDYLIAVLYHKDVSFAAIVDTLPRRTFATGELRKVVNERYNQSIFDRLLISGQIYCLTYREKYQKTTFDGNKSVYGHLWNMMFDE